MYRCGIPDEECMSKYSTCPGCGGSKRSVAALCKVCRKSEMAARDRRDQPSYPKWLAHKKTQANLLRVTRKAQGLCVGCGGVRDTSNLKCAPCAQKASTTQRAKIQLDRALEVCTKCRKAPAESNAARCGPCRIQLRSRSQKSNETTKAWRARVWAETVEA